MYHFRHTILHQVMSASGEKEVESVVDHSIQRLKSKNVNGHIIQRFILAMDKALCQAKQESPSEKAELNIDIAIDLFKQLQRP